ncbi:MAG: hypothetical protein J6N45_03320 [Alphaproteobacteria bacterium]|nr:hypothetical protein [Alphaproteobacteria bacterium]
MMCFKDTALIVISTGLSFLNNRGLEGARDDMVHASFLRFTVKFFQKLRDFAVKQFNMNKKEREKKMKYLLPLVLLLIFSAAHAEDTVIPQTVEETEVVPENAVSANLEQQTQKQSDSQTDDADKKVDEQPILQESVVRDDVFLPQFVNALHSCMPAMAQNPQDASDAPLIIVGPEENACHLKYGDFNLFLPTDILPNLHGFNDVQILLRNRELAHFDYQPQYVYSGLLHALNSCKQGTNYLGVEKVEEKGNIRTTNSLEAEYFQDICTIYLVSKLEVEGAETDYTVTCKIGANAVIGLLDYYRELLDKYGEKRTTVNGKPKIISEQENDETQQADAELMYFLQQKGYCQRPNGN